MTVYARLSYGSHFRNEQSSYDHFPLMKHGFSPSGRRLAWVTWRLDRCQGSSDERTQTQAGRRQLSLSRQRLRWYIWLQETRLNTPLRRDAGKISQTPMHITRICNDAGLHWAIAERLWTLSRWSKKPRERSGKLAVHCLCRVRINIQYY